MLELPGRAAAFRSHGDGAGYWLVASDGGIFNFSPQPFAGSLGANPPPRPVVSVAAL